MRYHLVLVAMMLGVAVAETRGARGPLEAVQDEVALAFADPTAWRCAGHDGCVDCTNVTGGAATVRLLGRPTPGDMAVRPGATLHICPE